MFSNKRNLKLLRNFCKICFRRLADVNVVDRQKQPLIFQSDKLFAQEDINRYNSRLPELFQSFCDHHADFEAPTKRFATNFSQILTQKKGLKVVELYKNITNFKYGQETKNAEILGWCSEIILHTIQIYDIMENNKVFYGKSNYHTWEDVGIYSINDMVLMEYLSYFLLENFFGTKPWYRNCVDMLHEMRLKTAIAQSFEKSLRNKSELQFQNITLQNYKSYAIYKSAYASVQIPLMFSHFAAENYDVELPEKARNILDELGLFLTVQNDMVNCLSDFEGTGNISDISRGGFTWLIAQGLIRETSGQKKILRQHYGVDNSESVFKVIGVYDDLKMFDLYERYKTKSRDYVYGEIERAPISRAHKNSVLKMTELLY